MVCADSDGVYGSSFLLPRSADDLLKRRLMHQTWAEATFGIMGRSTDFMSAMLTTWFVNAHFFGDYADNVRRYFRLVRDEDLFLTHALINPQVDRSKPPSQQPDPYTYLGVVRGPTRISRPRGQDAGDRRTVCGRDPVWPSGEHAGGKVRGRLCDPDEYQGAADGGREPLTRETPMTIHRLAVRRGTIVISTTLVPWKGCSSTRMSSASATSGR
jgi:hypothetical protein